MEFDHRAVPPDDRRPTPTTWATWLRGLLSGDEQCWWKSWYRTHYVAARRPVDDDGAGRMALWRAQHAEMVRAVRDRYMRDGWDVATEHQNRITVAGSVITAVAVPDLVAVKMLDATSLHRLIVDCKTGKERASDRWQVMVYGVLMKWHRPQEPTRIEGLVVYLSGEERKVSAQDIVDAEPHVRRALSTMSGEHAPDRVPSAQECQFCDIAHCDVRVQGTAETSTSDEF